MVGGQCQGHSAAVHDLVLHAGRISPIFPTPRIVACGRLITGLIAVIPNMPRLDTVNVPPESSGGVTSPALTRAASRVDDIVRTYARVPELIDGYTIASDPDALVHLRVRDLGHLKRVI